jgi:hypothetical protein
VGWRIKRSDGLNGGGGWGGAYVVVGGCGVKLVLINKYFDVLGV